MPTPNKKRSHSGMHLVFFRFPYKLSIEEDDNFSDRSDIFMGRIS